MHNSESLPDGRQKTRVIVGKTGKLGCIRFIGNPQNCAAQENRMLISFKLEWKHPHKLKVMLNELMGKDASEILNSGGAAFGTIVWPNLLQTRGVLLVDGVVTLITTYYNHGQRIDDGIVGVFFFQDTSTMKF